MPELAGRDVSVLIWTTTPWTIPSNLAVAFHPELDYAAYDVDGRAVIVAEGLAAAVSQAVGRPLDRPVARMKGEQLEGIRFRHPLYERDSIGVLGSYVTLDAGTGAVHTAPGHGADDFNTGKTYGLEIYAPIGPAGHFLDSVELVRRHAGVRRESRRSKRRCKARGRLWHREAFSHQYPHCWRCHNPVIFLATSQWFIRLDGVRLKPVRSRRGDARIRRDAGRGTDPARGRDRRGRSSRQVGAGVGPRSHLQHDRQPPRLVHLAPARVGRADSGRGLHGLRRGAHDDRRSSSRRRPCSSSYGADAWYERPTEEFIPPGLTCPSCGGTTFEREMNILDVWFDSGSSHEAVLSVRPELTWPADIYLEGSDQHRGWFQSSLLVGLGTRGRAPFREVVTHGFIVAEDGRKMSKSLGNSIEPQDIIKQSGADILRLWVVDERLHAGDSHQQGDPGARRRGVPEDPQHAAVSARESVRLRSRPPTASPRDRLEEVDRYILARYADAAQRMLAAYEELRLRHDLPVGERRSRRSI